MKRALEIANKSIIGNYFLGTWDFEIIMPFGCSDTTEEGHDASGNPLLPLACLSVRKELNPVIHALPSF